MRGQRGWVSPRSLIGPASCCANAVISWRFASLRCSIVLSLCTLAYRCPHCALVAHARLPSSDAFSRLRWANRTCDILGQAATGHLRRRKQAQTRRRNSLEPGTRICKQPYRLYARARCPCFRESGHPALPSKTPHPVRQTVAAAAAVVCSRASTLRPAGSLRPR